MKKHIFKGHRLTVGLSLLTLTAATAAVISTISWYTVRNNFTPTDVSSSVITQYFDSGEGTSANPFVITRPIHYYNMVYLHQNNEYQVGGVNFADAGLYFQLGKLNINGVSGDDDDSSYLFYKYDNDGVLQYKLDGETEDTADYLNLNYYSGDKALLPLGTTTHPFIGHLSGHDLTVRNIHINGNGMADIGIFGYVGSAARITNTYYDGVTIDTKTANPSASSGTGHSAHTTHSYIGFIAGHVSNPGASFSHVYVNDCRIYNSEDNSSEMINSYGYFGKTDFPSSSTGSSSSYSTRINPVSAYNAINNTYSDGANKNLVTRNTSYTATGLYSSAMADNTDTTGAYDLVNSNGHTHSLSTIGYASTDSITKHIRYFDNTLLKKVPSSTIRLDSKPANADAWNALDDGYYVYYDTDDKKWYFTELTANSSQQQQQVDFNVFIISYEVSSTKYYWKYDGTSFTTTTTAPTQQTIDDYYFALQTSFSSKGVATIEGLADPFNAYVYSPAHEAYMVGNTNGTATVPTFTKTSGAATSFAINGPSSTFTYHSDCALILDGSTVKSRQTAAGIDPASFDIGTIQSRTTDSGSEFELVTSASQALASGDRIIFVNGADLPASYSAEQGRSALTNYHLSIMTNQNGNNRNVYRITSSDYDDLSITTSDGVVPINAQNFNATTKKIAYDSNYTIFQVGTDGGYYTFLDTKTNKYIGNVSGSSNKIQSYDSISDNSRWEITNSATGLASIAAKTGDRKYLSYNYSVSNQMVFAFEIFSCYASARPGAYMYRKVAQSGTVEYYSNAESVTFTSSIAMDKVVTKKEMYTAGLNVADPDNAANYDQNKPFNVAPTQTISVTFNFTTSKVTYTLAAQGWTLVNDESELTAGDTVVFAYKAGNKTLGTISSQRLAGLDSTFSSGDKTTIDTLNASTQQYIVSAGSTSGTLSFAYNQAGTPQYLHAASGSANLATNTTKNAETSWKVTISNGEASICNQDSIDDDGGDATKRRYLLYSTQYSYAKAYQLSTANVQLVNIYRYNESSQNADLFISDLIGDRYDPDYVDVTGNASFYSDHIAINGSSSTITLSNSDLGTKFRSTSFTTGAVVLFVDNVDSRDLGTIVYNYYSSGETPSVPQFNSNGAVKTMVSEGARDIDDTSAFSLIYTMSTANIKKTALCAVDSSGNICEIYNSNGSVAYTNSNAIAKYVVVITNSTGAINITNVEFTFTAAEGNVGDFGNVGYRSATDKLEHTIINMYYHIDNSSQQVSCQVSYNATTQTYTITFTSNVDMVLNVFNYDANHYNLIVNGVQYYAGTNVINITGTP